MAAMTEGLSWSTVLTCNAQASIIAPAFWESLGFRRVDHPRLTHILDRQEASERRLPLDPGHASG